jgi:hypothetical protein
MFNVMLWVIVRLKSEIDLGCFCKDFISTDVVLQELYDRVVEIQQPSGIFDLVANSCVKEKNAATNHTTQCDHSTKKHSHIPQQGRNRWYFHSCVGLTNKTWTLSTGVCPLPTPVVWSFARPLRKPWTSLTAISFPQCSG